MASGNLGWLLSAWIFTQLTGFSAAIDLPVHVELKLDGKESYGTHTLPADRVVIWYNAQDPTNLKYNNPSQKNLVEKAGLKKLYISGTFQVVGSEGSKQVYRDNEKKVARDLGEIVLKIFKEGCVVVVVFPDVLHTYAGFQFQKEFEETVRKQNKQIIVGRGVINVYLGFGNQEREMLLDVEKERQRKATENDYQKNEKYYSIFVNYETNKFEFSTVFYKWQTPRSHINIFQINIQEADNVLVRLVSTCTSEQNRLKVGSHTVQELADILFKLLRTEEVKTHPQQRIRVELPKSCGDQTKREDFTGLLVDTLQGKNLRVYGKEPVVHLQIYQANPLNKNGFTSDVNHILKVHPEDIPIQINNNQFSFPGKNDAKTSVSSAKEMFLHIHCHGNFYANSGTICSVPVQTLAVNLSTFMIPLLENSVPKTGFVIFHICEAGGKDGQKHVIHFLTEFANVLQPHKITIQESVSYGSRTSQVSEHTMVEVPMKPSSSRTTPHPVVNEKHVFCRRTVRTVKTAAGYKAYKILPLTEYDMFYKD